MRRLFLPISIFMCLLLSGCTGENVEEHAKTVFAMDTVMDLKIYSANGEAVLQEAENEIKRIENLLDRGNENSEIYQINKDKSYRISEETIAVINNALSVSEETGGAFDITIAPIIDLWGFYGNHCRVPSDSELQTALENVGYEKVRLNGSNILIPENALIDLGGIGKGYTSDRIAALFKKNNIHSAIVSLGGNVQTIGKKPDGSLWTIGVADPHDASKHIGILKISDKAVVTSGGYQRYFEQDGVRYHHIINPDTGKSAESGLASVTIISDSGTRADGLSTALFVMGLEKSIAFWRSREDFDAIFVDNDGTVLITEGIQNSFECVHDCKIIEK